ncbi:hypothetical protein FQA47_008429 [Oryzias melastigma]|uniref:PB1 domain-containing protein n=1 Tax=Oryzias melastigma TaxID=30732 RepID=A0A834CQ01_ORYME|nr:hypothetical protein FQA47_008416 [Oryzias melastigma]KAF6730808.1 hypothetical protein FQA47_008429 [Oryzias melastigma]
MAAVTPIRLLIVLNEENSVRMELLDGIPKSPEELNNEVKNACGLEGHIRLQYKDCDFGNTFVNLTSTTVIKDLTTLKVIQLDPETTTLTLYPVTFPESSNTSSCLDSDDSLVSANTDDTILLSSPLLLRTQQWPQVFQIPKFSYDTECQLQRANLEYIKNQTKLTPSSKVLSDVLEKLAESIYAYTPYPEDCHYSDVAEALTTKHPCLREPGSFNLGYGWKQRLKIKMGNYRTQLKAHGTSAELTVNSLKSKNPEDSYPAKNLKRPRRAEVNHFPSLPNGETTDSLEQERISLLAETQKRNNRQIIKEKMFKTFGYRRQEIVLKQPTTEDILARWPALFQIDEINLEFLRVTTIPLEPKFLSQLDKYSDRLREIIKSKGGRVKEETTRIFEVLDELSIIDITISREAILKSLMIFLGESVEDLIKEYQDVPDSDVLLETMAIFVIGREDPFSPPTDIKIVIDGKQVLSQVPSVATAIAMFFGLSYALNLKYPKKLKYTLEFIQKVLMEIGGKKMSPKVYRLSTQLQFSG